MKKLLFLGISSLNLMFFNYNNYLNSYYNLIKIYSNSSIISMNFENKVDNKNDNGNKNQKIIENFNNNNGLFESKLKNNNLNYHNKYEHNLYDVSFNVFYSRFKSENFQVITLKLNKKNFDNSIFQSFFIYDTLRKNPLLIVSYHSKNRKKHGFKEYNLNFNGNQWSLKNLKKSNGLITKNLDDIIKDTLNELNELNYLVNLKY